MNAEKTILIVGGSGMIGRKIAKDLASDYPNQVVIAARDVEKASLVASEIGFGVQAQHLDITNRSSVNTALQGVGFVISCVTQRETPHLFLAAITQGCGYTDIAPMWAHKYPLSEALRAEAVNTGARIIIGAGIVPGISSVLARKGADWVGPVESITTTCLLSAGDEYGTNSRENLGEEFATPFKTTIDGQKVLAWPFTRPHKVEFAPPVGTVTAYLMPFVDQLFYPETLGAQTAVSQMAYLPLWLPRLVSALLPIARRASAQRRSGMGRNLDRILAWLKGRYQGLNWWGAHVEVWGAKGIYRASIQGHEQATGTALSGSALLRALVEGEVDRPGIWTAEQVVSPERFLKRLAGHGLIPTVSAS